MTVHGEGKIYTLSLSLTATVSMSGRVLDAAGQPVFARVEAKRCRSEFIGRDIEPCALGTGHPNCFTDPETGEFDLPWMPAGQYELSLLSARGGKNPDPDAPPQIVSTHHGPVRDIELLWLPGPPVTQPHRGYRGPTDAGSPFDGSVGPPTNPAGAPR